jgi:hypothetical protein
MGKGDKKKTKKSKNIDVNVNVEGVNINTETVKKVGRTVERASKRVKNAGKGKEIFFDKSNYSIIGVGLFVVIVGLLLMSGGNNAPENWDANAIYNWRRITLAPLVILAGLGVVVYAIFKSSATE